MTPNSKPQEDMTQTETIVWKRYPENKPEESGDYWVTTKVAVHGNIYVSSGPIRAFWGNDDSCWHVEDRSIVIAFAELPKGWEDK